jgi:SnoaL-like protein
MTTEKTRELVRAYYDSWMNGSARFDEAKLRGVLAPRLTFESPLSRRDDAESLVEAIRRFATTLRELRLVATLVSGDDCAMLYECDLEAPRGTTRFAEFFRIEGERIASIRLVFDASEYRKLAK